MADFCRFLILTEIVLNHMTETRAPIGFSKYQTEPIGFDNRPVTVLQFTETEVSVNLPNGIGKFGIGIGFTIYRTDLPNIEFYDYLNLI